MFACVVVYLDQKGIQREWERYSSNEQHFAQSFRKEMDGQFQSILDVKIKF